MKLSEVAYNKFKEHLFAREVRPGQFVSQRELVKLTGIPLGPMREALQRLDGEGLVQIIPRRGIRVTEANLKLIRDTFHLRSIIEKEAARKFAECALAAEIQELEDAHVDIVERVEAGITDRLLKEAQEVDRHMHHTMVEALENEIISQIHSINTDRIKLIRLDHGLLTPSTLVQAMEEHLAVIRACKRRDDKGAEHAMEVHLSTALRRAMGL